MRLRNPPLLDVHRHHGIVVVRFCATELLDESVIEQVSKRLFGLLVESENGLVVLNCSGLEIWSSSMIGKLISLRHKAVESGGRVALCSIHPNLEEMCQRLMLSRLFMIVADEEKAIEALRHFQQQA